MKIAVIKYNAGNIRSVSFALERLGVSFDVTDDAEEISSADKVIFPGVGEAQSTMRYLRERQLDQVIKTLRQPVLGICLGMQLLCQASEENATACLGVFDETVKRFPSSPGVKVPHMGWNQLTAVTDWIDPSLSGREVYYVHSYYVPVNTRTSAQTHYIVPFSAAMRKDNFYAVQFHPEKSARTGETILKNFLAI